MTTNYESREIEAREKEAVETEGTRPGLVFRPDVDILEREDAYLIHADLPGVTEESVEVNLDKGVLTLEARPAGGAADSAEEEGVTRLHREYRSGGYYRQFRVSEKIDTSGVSARMRDGVLELVLPKTAEHQPRRIAVEAA